MSRPRKRLNASRIYPISNGKIATRRLPNTPFSALSVSVSEIEPFTKDYRYRSTPRDPTQLDYLGHFYKVSIFITIRMFLGSMF